MSLTVFVFLAIAIGGGAFLYGRLPAGAVSNRIEQLFQGRGQPKGRAASRARPNRKERRVSRYRAVSLVCGENPCAAAAKLAGKRALVGQFPKTPLTLCDAAVCNCTFEHHEDRRSGEDRREILKSLANDKDARFNEFKSRSGKDRRRASRKEDRDEIDISYD